MSNTPAHEPSSFLDSLEEDLPKLAREPDYVWRRENGHMVRVWIVEEGRRVGVRVDATIDGKAIQSATHPGPGMAHDAVKRWRDIDTAYMRKPVPMAEVVLPSGRRGGLVRKQQRQRGRKLVDGWTVRFTDEKGGNPVWVPETEVLSSLTGGSVAKPFDRAGRYIRMRESA